MEFKSFFTHRLPNQFYLKLHSNKKLIYVDRKDLNGYDYRKHGDLTVKSITSHQGLLIFSLY